jgi:hypothetical protein
MLGVKEEQEMKNKGLLQNRRERDSTKKLRRRAGGQGNEDQVDEYLPQPNAAYSTSIRESSVLKSGVHPSNRIRQIIKKRQIVRQIDEQQAWAQSGGSIPQDQNHTSNEVRSINQVETNVERHIRLVQKDICRVLEQQVEIQVNNLPQDQQGDGYFPTAGQQENK